MSAVHAVPVPLANYVPEHFLLAVESGVATVTLNRPERKNPLTFDSYGELRDMFYALQHDEDVRAVVLTGAGGNFCSGGDVYEIIEPLTKRDMKGSARLHPHDRRPRQGHAGLPAAHRRRGRRRVRRRRRHPRHGVRHPPRHAGGKGRVPVQPGGARRLRHGGLRVLPRLVGHGRASELLFTGRSLAADEAERWGFFNRLVGADTLDAEAGKLAASLAAGPAFANAMTKRMLHMEWDMGVDQAIEAEAMAQAVCMQTKDFRRAFDAFAAKRKPVFEGD
jgi:enoyl-CoA hydratase/carnithine racemase